MHPVHPIRRGVVCLVIGAVAFGACDSQTPRTFDLNPDLLVDDPDSLADLPCAPGIWINRELPDTVLVTGQDTLRIAVESDVWPFAHPNLESMTYGAETSPEGIVDILRDGERNENIGFAAVELGTVDVRINASDRCGNKAHQDFQARVVTCPVEPTAGEADYLSVHVGDSWRYSYSHHKGSPWSSESVAGWTRLTAVESVCTGSRRVIRLHMEGEFDINTTVYGEGEQSSTNVIDKVVQWIEFEDGRALHPFATDRIQRFHPVLQDTIEVAGGAVRLLTGPCSFERLTLKISKDEGIVSGSFSQCLGSAAVFSSGRWTLTDFQAGG